MKLYLKILIFGLAMVLMASAASAQVRVAPNGKGDLVIFPMYLTGAGIDSEFTIINTDRVNSTVAKIVIRSYANSEELLDFLIYLSPADVWTGKLYTDAVGQVRLWSDDDSIVKSLNPLTFASPDNPVDQPVFELSGPDDAEWMGYMYAINVATFTVGTQTIDDVKRGIAYDKNYDGVDTLLTRPIEKKYVYDAYRTTDDEARNPDNLIGGERLDVYGPVDIDFEPENILAAKFDWVFNGFPGRSSLKPVVLADYLNRTTILPFYESVMAPTSHQDIYQYTADDSLNTLTMDPSGGSSDTWLVEIEAALAKNFVAMPYYNSNDAISIHFFNFPTKYTKLDIDGDFINTAAIPELPIVEGKWPTQISFHQGFKTMSTASDALKRACVEYSRLDYDLKENLKVVTPEEELWSGGPVDITVTDRMCEEVNLRAGFNPDFAQGWSHYSFFTVGSELTKVTQTGPTGFVYDGAPVIPVILDWEYSAEEWGISLSYGSWTDTDVAYKVEDDANPAAQNNIVAPGFDTIHFYQYTGADLPRKALD